MDTIYAFLIFLAVVFIVYQVDRLLGMSWGNRRKRDDESDTVEAQELSSEHVSESEITRSESSISTIGTTKDEMIHNLAEENARLQEEVDALRKQLVALFDAENDESDRYDVSE